MIRRGWVLAVVLVTVVSHPAAAQTLLIPMDQRQSNHLRAYGLVYRSILGGERAEWLLNYRGGSFLLPDVQHVRRNSALLGVTSETLSGSELARLRERIENSNMESVPLEKAPEIAVYTPPNSSPWDDAVTLALEYAGIPYARIWDPEVLSDGLEGYDWLRGGYEGDEARARIEKVKALKAVAEELGCTRAQLALAWCLKNPRVSTVITGASRVEHPADDAELLRLP